MTTGWFRIVQDVGMPSSAVDEIPTHLHPHHPHHHLPSPNPVVNVLLVGCAYEATAAAVNAWLGEPALPLLSNGIKAFTWGAFGRKVVPAWSLPAGLVGVGFVLTIAVVGPRRRRQWRKSLERAARNKS